MAKPGRKLPPCPDVDELRAMIERGCLQAEIMHHFRKGGRTVKKWIALNGLPEPQKPYRCPPPARTGSIYTSKHALWQATNTQEKIDALFPPEERGRFWSRVLRGADDECWLWSGSKSKDGYGHHGARKLLHRVHRLAYMLAKGPVPADLHVMHMCNTRLCCNPAHLRAGTVQENVAHREKYGNPAKAMRSGRRKLRADEVYAIRESSEHPAVLGKRYGIHPTHIVDIQRRKNWRSLPERPAP